MQATGSNKTGRLRLGAMHGYGHNKSPIQSTIAILVALALLQFLSFILTTALAQPIAAETSKPSEIASPVGATPVEAATNLGPLQQSPVASEPAALQEDDPSLALSRKHTNTAEKLKRGLSNFLNQSANPASFFVPAAPVEQRDTPPQAAAADKTARPLETHALNKARSFVNSSTQRWGRR